MKQVKIANLKAHLSEHLRSVRRGESITVLDRDTPVARLVPVGSSENGLVIRPAKTHRKFSDIPLPPKPAGLKTDPVQLLLEDRQKR
jgi:prevent-host-death family protein